MNIKDVKVGMVVKLNSPYVQGVGEVELISDSGLVQVRLDGVVTDSMHNTGSINNRWRTYPDFIEPYQDPEADMVVWDALEVGEHFIATAGYEAVKINDTQYVLLGGGGKVFTVLDGRLGRHTKVKLA
ncbi:hypothetical protein Stuart_18 [Providencia phage vB_PstP_PS3]|uniref:Uncharacterized protein n=1 Tax=Providencia phage vB_PstP_PS3 TaxID=2848038 RepID=A0A411AWG2_9CAUD|nr:hypothetical protein HOV05_gp18 [Providencia phage vB_PstP_PS3]QAX92410.1 hypothetical protein Stuart_18 [Providencia phage vB_PstP_PS3]